VEGREDDVRCEERARAGGGAAEVDRHDRRVGAAVGYARRRGRDIGRGGEAGAVRREVSTGENEDEEQERKGGGGVHLG